MPRFPITETEHNGIFSTHVVFVDIVHYSRRIPAQQKAVVERLVELIRQSVRAQELDERVVYCPSGDGAAICWKAQPTAAHEPMNFVIHLRDSLKAENNRLLSKVGDATRATFLSSRWSDEVSAFQLRMGVAYGALFAYSDLNEHTNHAGTAINEAARLLQLAEPEQIMFTPEAKRFVTDSAALKVRFDGPKTASVKGKSYEGWLFDSTLPHSSQDLEDVEPASSADPGRDILPHVWHKTYHSVPRPNWSTSRDDQRARAISIACLHFSRHIRQPSDVTVPPHQTSADVYRVANADSGEAIFLKCYRQPRADYELHAVATIEQSVADSGIFPKYGSYTKSLTTNQGRSWAIHEGMPVRAFPFLEEFRSGKITHFSGRSLDELASVGEKLGQVNKLLIEQATDPSTERDFLLDPEHWEKILRHVRSSVANPMITRCTYLARAELQRLQRCFDELESFARDRQNKSVGGSVTLTAFHPHNVFIENRNCVLIIDYDSAKAGWPEVANCGFAVHRFCREHMRQIVRGAHSTRDLAPAARRAVRSFVNGYTRARQGGIDNEIFADGTRWAKAINLAKILQVLAYECGLEADPESRGEDYLFKELVKFMSYLSELDYLESELRWMD